MIFPSNVLAAETAELGAALEGLTAEEAAIGGAFLGMAFSLFLVLAIGWYILTAIADWKIFTKAGEAGWKSIIPIYNIIVEFRLCWSGVMGAFFCVAALVANIVTAGQNLANWQMIVGGVLLIVMLVLYFIQSMKLSKAFGKGAGFGICLLLFGPLARLVLGFGSARYVGRPN
jgi:hypothetical protein